MFDMGIDQNVCALVIVIYMESCYGNPAPQSEVPKTRFFLPGKPDICWNFE